MVMFYREPFPIDGYKQITSVFTLEDSIPCLSVCAGCLGDTALTTPLALLWWGKGVLDLEKFYCYNLGWP